MKISAKELNEPREMSEDEIDLVSTSKKTADASPIILKKTDMVQLKFEPAIIDNENSPEECVSGKLIYERKYKKDLEFPTEKITKQSVKSGEHIEIQLRTGETYTLFSGLQRLYKLKNDIRYTPIGSATYTKIDDSFNQFYDIIQKDPSAARLLSNEENYELVKLLLKLITQANSLDSLKNSLKSLEESNVSVLSNALNVERLGRILELLEKNLDNNKEDDWQQIFKDNQWILSQIFSCPYTIFREKAYVGGKGLQNTGGNLCDFIYQNNITQNIALIEIKTPCTSLIGTAYRGTFSLSADLSGAINQVINYKDKLTKEYYSLNYNSSKSVEVFNPKCFVIAGKMTLLNSNQISMIENYRNSLMNIEILTFDELVRRIRGMLSLFKDEENHSDEEISYDYVEEKDLPF